MSKYVVHYEMRKDGFGVKSASTPGGSPKTIECESEATAMQIAESQAKAKHPDTILFLRRLKKDEYRRRKSKFAEFVVQCHRYLWQMGFYTAYQSGAVTMTNEQESRCHKIIHSHAVAAAGNAVPIPGLGIAVDIVTITTMAMSLCGVFGGNISEATARNLAIVSIKSAALKAPIRTVTRELSKLIPGLGRRVDSKNHYTFYYQHDTIPNITNQLKHN